MTFLFGDMVLDSERRELRSGSALIPIEPQVFDILDFLIRNRDRVVSKDDLLTAIWGGRLARLRRGSMPLVALLVTVASNSTGYERLRVRDFASSAMSVKTWARGR